VHTGALDAADSMTVIEDFETFFALEQRAALRLAFVLTGDAHAAEDLVADAFARLYPKFVRSMIDEPAAYLRTAIVNGARGRWRTILRPTRAPRERRVADVADASVERDRVLRVLTTLSPGQRAAVALRFLDDCSETDTARIMGVSVGTVKAHASRGLDRLRVAMAEEET
jgi:RNA polymerase sigma-70 factor (sigma-E family)